MTHTVEFFASGRGKARCPSNPEYPSGIALDISDGKEGCTVNLPYPAPECGHFVVCCITCGYNIAVTAVGRPDDPKSVKIPCALVKGPIQ